MKLKPGSQIARLREDTSPCRAAAATIALVAGVIVLGWEFLIWLKSGTWHPLAFGQFLFNLLDAQGPFLGWVAKPNSWCGVEGKRSIRVAPR